MRVLSGIFLQRLGFLTTIRIIFDTPCNQRRALVKSTTDKSGRALDGEDSSQSVILMLFGYVPQNKEENAGNRQCDRIEDAHLDFFREESGNVFLLS